MTASAKNLYIWTMECIDDVQFMKKKFHSLTYEQHYNLLLLFFFFFLMIELKIFYFSHKLLLHVKLFFIHKDRTREKTREKWREIDKKKRNTRGRERAVRRISFKSITSHFFSLFIKIAGKSLI